MSVLKMACGECGSDEGCSRSTYVCTSPVKTAFHDTDILVDVGVVECGLK